MPAIVIINSLLEACEYMYTVSQIKTPMRTIVHNFVKFLPIFTIL